jgi:hypothetical protein
MQKPRPLRWNRYGRRDHIVVVLIALLHRAAWSRYVRMGCCLTTDCADSASRPGSRQKHSSHRGHPIPSRNARSHPPAPQRRILAPHPHALNLPPAAGHRHAGRPRPPRQRRQRPRRWTACGWPRTVRWSAAAPRRCWRSMRRASKTADALPRYAMLKDSGRRANLQFLRIAPLHA